MIAKSKGWYVSVLTAAAMAAVSTPSTTTTSSTTSSQSSPSMNHVVSAFLPIHTTSNRHSRMSSSLLLPVPTGTRNIVTPKAPTHLYEAIQQSHHSNEHDSSNNNGNSNDNELDGNEKSVRSIRMTSTTSNKNEDDIITITPNESSSGSVDDASTTTTTTTVNLDVVYPFNDQINTFVESSLSTSNMNHNLTETTVVPSTSSSSSSSSLSSSSSSSSSSFTLEETKQIRVAKAQAEIDRILSHPDGPPFDIESEMKKVISINCDDDDVVDDVSQSEHQDEDEDDISRSSGVTRRSILPTNTKKITRQLLTDEKQIEMIMDRHEEMTSYDIESQLYEAIRKQDYTTAAVQQKALQQFQYDATIQVLQCNSAFYKAFSKKDYKSMELLWLPNDPHVLCIHPSHVPIVSSHNINQSWKQMFTSNGSNFQKTWIEPTNIRINVRGNHMAVVTCDEQVYIRRFVRGQKRQTELINTLTATNIYYKLHQRWYMIHHHASWHPSSDAAKTALSRSTGSSSSSSSSYVASLKKRQEAVDAHNSSNDNNNNNNNGFDGILGMKGVGPLLGDLKPKKLLSPGSQQQQNASPPPQRRIVMGSLSDILNGNLEDLLNGGGGGANKNSDKKGNDDEGSAIIQFHRIESEGDDDEDDDDEDIDLELDDDEEDDEVDDDEEEVEIDISTKVSRSNGKKEAISMIQEWASRRGSDDDNAIKNTNDSTSNKKQTEVDMTIRKQQQCLTLIRQLCSEGLISQQHKRTLLTDMISSSNASTSSITPTTVQKSRIQLAYEFLFANHLDGETDETDDTMYDIAREEFADQCRIIAESMSSQS